jgi:opacity protein-like surface antigen
MKSIVAVPVLVLVMILGIACEQAVAEEYTKQFLLRGGGAFLTSPRSNEIFTDVNGASGTKNDNTVGYYIYAGIQVKGPQLWGGTIYGESGMEFKRFNSETVAQAAPTLAAAGVRTGNVPLTMLTVNFSPKYMYDTGTKWRPWVIPLGLGFHVISPPSNSTTYLDIGVHWGAGIEYALTDQFVVGLDGRFHLLTGQTGTTNNFATVGPYVGINF